MSARASGNPSLTTTIGGARQHRSRFPGRLPGPIPMLVRPAFGLACGTVANPKVSDGRTPVEPASARRITASAAVLTGHPDDVVRVLDRLDAAQLANVAEAIRQVQRRRAMADGDLDAIVATGFEVGFGRDGLAVLPWVEGQVVVCPGGLVSKSRTSHRCRFVSVDDVWVWESPELIREDKRSTPGVEDGFRAVALVPLLDGLTLDVVSGRARQGQHAVDRVVSYEIRSGDLVEVAQRVVTPAGMH